MKLSSRLTFIFGLLLLIFAGVTIFFNHQGFGLRLLTLLFWILLLATIQYVWEIKNER